MTPTAPPVSSPDATRENTQRPKVEDGGTPLLCFFTSKPTHYKAPFNNRIHRPRNMSVRRKSDAPKPIVTKPTCGGMDWSMPVPHKPNLTTGYVNQDVMDILHTDSLLLVTDDALLRTRAQVALHETALMARERDAHLTTITLILGMHLALHSGSDQMRVQNLGHGASPEQPPVSYTVGNFTLYNFVMAWTDLDGMEWRVPLQTILRVN